jgi:hypothetical protein
MCVQFKVKMAIADDESRLDISVEGDKEECERLYKVHSRVQMSEAVQLSHAMTLHSSILIVVLCTKQIGDRD